MSDDSTLLRQYVTEGSEAAFAELVRRHIDLVHSVALRQVNGDSHRAEDVTQGVFCELARKAPQLLRHRALSGWLYTTARFVGARLARTESRRTIRELTSGAMNLSHVEPANDQVWKELQPVLDDAMQELKSKDRDALLLRFFENKPLTEVGRGLGLSDNAARMRVERAIEKLRGALARRGITSSASVLTAVLMSHAVVPAPSALAAAIVGPALASALSTAAMSGSSLLGIFHIMNSTKIGIGVAAVAMATTVGTYTSLKGENDKLSGQVTALQAELLAAMTNSTVQPAAAPDVDPTELARLRASHGELMRLRGEVGVLRRKTEEMALAAQEQKASDRSSEAQLQALQQSRAFNELIGSAKMNFVRGWYDALQAFAQARGGKLPSTLDEAETYFQAPGGWQWTTGLLSKDEFEIVFHGSLRDLPNPERTIVLREREPFDVKESGAAKRTYLFADGHSEIHVAQNGDFEPWERERMVARGN